MSSSNPSVSVVVPVFNGGDDFERCLAALAAADPAPLEVIVVDDASTDGSGALARRLGFRVVDMLENSGQSSARNIGVAVARGDVFFFVDADVVARPDSIGRVANAFARDPSLSALFGSYDDTPGRPEFLSQYRNLLHHYVHQTAREEASTFWGGFGAVRRDAFEEMGGFNVAYRCLEDIELGYRLNLAGRRVAIDKELQGTHLKRWTFGLMLKTDFFCRALPWTTMLVEGRPFVNDLNLKLSSRVSVALVFLLAALAPVAAFLPVAAATAAAAIVAALLCLNRDLYAFFHRKRGLRFTLGAVFAHWLYFLYSGCAFLTGIALAWVRSRLRAPRDAEAA